VSSARVSAGNSIASTQCNRRVGRRIARPEEIHSFRRVDCWYAAAAGHSHVVCHGILVACGHGGVTGRAADYPARVLPGPWRASLFDGIARARSRTTRSAVTRPILSVRTLVACGAHGSGASHAIPAALAATAAHEGGAARRAVGWSCEFVTSFPPARSSPLLLLVASLRISALDVSLAAGESA